MKWFTCIIHMTRHVHPVQLFHTRAEDATQAVVHAHRWILDGEPQWTPEDIDVPKVFEGRFDEQTVDWDVVNAAIGWVEPAQAPQPPSDDAFEEAQRYAIALNEQDRKRFAKWFAEWDRLITAPTPSTK